MNDTVSHMKRPQAVTHKITAISSSKDRIKHMSNNALLNSIRVHINTLGLYRWRPDPEFMAFGVVVSVITATVFVVAYSVNMFVNSWIVWLVAAVVAGFPFMLTLNFFYKAVDNFAQDYGLFRRKVAEARSRGILR